MTRALMIFALLAPAATQLAPAPPRASAAQHALCVPAPPRTTPRRKMDRVDKWQHDQRTFT